MRDCEGRRDRPSKENLLTITDEPSIETGVEPQTSGGSDLVVAVDAYVRDLWVQPGQKGFTQAQKEYLTGREVAVIGSGAVTLGQFADFLFTCVRHGLDPRAREVSLMRTETGYVTIITLDGLKRLAVRTGEFRGFTAAQWCDEDGTWYDVMPRGQRPYGARAGVRRLDWGDPDMSVVYTHEVEVWETHVDPRTRAASRRLAQRWQTGDGGSVCSMVAKCARAAALRATFPDETEGLYTPEEMQRVRDRNREAREREAAAAGREARRQAYAAATVGEDGPGSEDSPPEPVGEPVEGIVTHHAGRTFDDPMVAAAWLRERATRHPSGTDPEGEPAGPSVTVDDTAPEGGPALPLTESERVDALRAECVEQAAILGVDVAVLTARRVTASGVPADGWDAATWLRCVSQMRRLVAARLRAVSRYAEAAAYAEVVGTDVVDHPDVLFGRA
jgi:hypothetical protein